MIIYGLKWINKKWGVRGVTLGQLTIICVLPDDAQKEITENHEAIHRAQFKECGGIIKTWKIYKADRKRLMTKYDDKQTANRFTMFEMEAYNNASNLNYLKTREAFAWRKYR